MTLYMYYIVYICEIASIAVSSGGKLKPLAEVNATHRVHSFPPIYKKKE